MLFLIITGVEYLMWFSPNMRLLLFLCFIGALVVLGYVYIFIPCTYIFRIRRGLNPKQASRLIGIHFKEVGDRLVNLLELSESRDKSDLLVAAIEQRSKEFRPLPFTEAIKVKEALYFARFLIIPAFIFMLVWLSGSIADFFNSYSRVVNYDLAYEQPAPFQFVLQNERLDFLENEKAIISVSTVGEITPESIFIELDGEKLLMQQQKGNLYEVTLTPPLRSLSFRFEANNVWSKTYRLEAIKVPAIVDFSIDVSFPRYLDLEVKKIQGTGNLTVPEGSELTWNIEGLSIDKIEYFAKDTVLRFEQKGHQYALSKKVFNTENYELRTSNSQVKNYEQLGYQIKVVKDRYPEIRISSERDSLHPNEMYFSGVVSDDYQITKVDLVAYTTDEPRLQRRLELLRSNSNIDEFYYTFPSGISIQEGKEYELYFEVWDNDGIRGGKSTQSRRFKTTIYDSKDLKNRELTTKRNLAREMGKGIKDLEKQNQTLEEINRNQKQEGNLEYKDQKEIKEFLKSQKEQEALMENFSKQMQESLSNDRERDSQNELLKERLQRQEQQAKRNQKLLEELEKVADKIEKEELKKRLEELAKSQRSNQRNLEQIVELTKRYYVVEKAAQLSQKLETLSEKQELLSKLKIEKDFNNAEQSELNKEFNTISQELNELKSDNRALRKPIDLDFNQNQQESIKQDQEDALEELNKHQGEETSDKSSEDTKKRSSKAIQKQQSAANKIKELSEQLQRSSAGGGGGSSVVEDAEMLRQILDNLVAFSFEQEVLFNQVSEDVQIAEFSNTVRKQKELRRLFEHVDDSLFALSLRRAELSEFVNDQITEVYYNVDKSLESIAENQVYQAASYQQYVLNATNGLAEFLAKILDNMQQSMMSGQGQGKGQGFQLPDIIKKQSELNNKMNEGSQGNKQGTQSSSGEAQEESKEGQGKEGKEGKKEGGKNEDSTSEGEQGKGGEKNGGSEEGSGSSGDGLSEGNWEEIYEIYQEQQTIRKALEEQVKNIIDKEKKDLARKLLLQMEQFENELLENGITQRTIDKINRIQQELPELENAALEQGKKKERESNTSQEQFSAPDLTKPSILKIPASDIEILNRQALPLRPDYQIIVKDYFEKSNQL